MGSNPVGDTYFHFELFAPSRSEQLSGAHANETKHDHSPVVIVVLRYPMYKWAIFYSW